MDFSHLIVLPLIFALFGLATTTVGVWAIFSPLKFFGIPPIFGWQGWIPARAAKIAPRLVAAVLARVGTVRDVYEYADPERIAEHLVYSLRPRLPELVENVFLDADPRLWDELSSEHKQEIASRLEQGLPSTVELLLKDIDANLEEILDVDYMTKVHLIDNPGMLVDLVRGVGKTELTFLQRVGFVIGLITGLISLGIYEISPHWWVAALSGLVLFFVGSYLALQSIFGWAKGLKLGTVNFQGLLYVNQEHGVRKATRIFTREIITIENLVSAVLTGPEGVKARNIIRSHAGPLVLNAIEPAIAIMQKSHSPEQVESTRDDIVERSIDIALEPLSDPTFNRERQIVLEDVFVHRMLDLTSEQYGELIIPALGGAQWLLPPVAGVVGFVTGLIADDLLSLF